MKLQNINEKKKAIPKAPPERKKRKGKDGELPIFRKMDYEYELNEKVVLTEEGWKQNTKLTKEHYRVTSVYLSNLGDMSCWMMTLNEEDDKNIYNPYIAHHFKPLNRKANETT